MYEISQKIIWFALTVCVLQMQQICYWHFESSKKSFRTVIVSDVLRAVLSVHYLLTVSVQMQFRCRLAQKKIHLIGIRIIQTSADTVKKKKKLWINNILLVHWKQTFCLLRCHSMKFNQCQNNRKFIRMCMEWCKRATILRLDVFIRPTIHTAKHVNTRRSK